VSGPGTRLTPPRIADVAAACMAQAHGLSAVLGHRAERPAPHGEYPAPHGERPAPRGDGSPRPAHAAQGPAAQGPAAQALAAQARREGGA